MPDTLDPRRWKRIAVLFAIALVVEVALMLVARFAPAMAGLMRPAYVIAATLAAFMIWNAWRRRNGSDRRQDERRDPSADEPNA